MSKKTMQSVRDRWFKDQKSFQLFVGYWFEEHDRKIHCDFSKPKPTTMMIERKSPHHTLFSDTILKEHYLVKTPTVEVSDANLSITYERVATFTQGNMVMLITNSAGKPYKFDKNCVIRKPKYNSDKRISAGQVRFEDFLCQFIDNNILHDSVIIQRDPGVSHLIDNILFGNAEDKTLFEYMLATA